MKLVRIRHGQKNSFGMLRNGQVELLSAPPYEENARPTGETIPFENVQLLAPTDPPDIWAVGLNYRDHARESGRDAPGRPVFFLKANSSINHPGGTITLPDIAPDEVDLEAELAVVIGKTARRIRPADVPEHVLGYTCANDVSARDCQLRLDQQWARGKSFDSFCPLGPWIETDLDPRNLHIASRLNGTTIQEAHTGLMIFDCADLVAQLSDCATLLPGTVILTGTPAGVGVARKPPLFLKPDDVVEIEIEGIGTLRNQVQPE